jgi:hypothetical protein
MNLPKKKYAYVKRKETEGIRAGKYYYHSDYVLDSEGMKQLADELETLGKHYNRGQYEIDKGDKVEGKAIMCEVEYGLICIIKFLRGE